MHKYSNTERFLPTPQPQPTRCPSPQSIQMRTSSPTAVDLYTHQQAFIPLYEEWPFQHTSKQSGSFNCFSALPGQSSPSSASSLPSSPTDFAELPSPTSTVARPGSPEEAQSFSPQRKGGRTSNFYWQEMAISCQELLLSCRQAEYGDVDGEDLKKVQDHIRKMATLCKAINDTLAQKRRRRGKWTTYHYYSPSRSICYPDDKEEEEEQGTEHRVCYQCNTSRSPEWRSGPLGSKTLCNACGIRYSKALRQERQGNPLAIKNLLN